MQFAFCAANRGGNMVVRDSSVIHVVSHMVGRDISAIHVSYMVVSDSSAIHVSHMVVSDSSAIHVSHLVVRDSSLYML